MAEIEVASAPEKSLNFIEKRIVEDLAEATSISAIYAIHLLYIAGKSTKKLLNNDSFLL